MKCEVCGQEFAREVGLKTHYGLVHAKKGHRLGEIAQFDTTCKNCGFNFPNRALLHKHACGEYRCKICGMGFGTKTGRDRHEMFKLH